MASTTAQPAADVLSWLSTNPISRLISGVLDKLRLPSCVISDVYGWVFESRVLTQTVQKYLFLLGGFLLLSRFLQRAYNLLRNWSWLPEHISVAKNFDPERLRERYGRDCWVVVTGFTHGIGLAYAKAFADLGYNLVLVGRNKDKIRHALKWVSQYNDQIMTKVIDLDFDADIDSLQKVIATETESIDVGILVNNAGVSSHGLFGEITPEEHIRTFKVNVLTPIEVTKAILPRMLKRPTRSAIVNVGSGVGEFASPGVGVYSMSKWYADVWTRTLQKELRDKVDVLMMRPLGVTTEMTGMWKGSSSSYRRPLHGHARGCGQAHRREYWPDCGFLWSIQTQGLGYAPLEDSRGGETGHIHGWVREDGSGRQKEVIMCQVIRYFILI